MKNTEKEVAGPCNHKVIRVDRVLYATQSNVATTGA
jgi:hypothetical protein